MIKVAVTDAMGLSEPVIDTASYKLGRQHADPLSDKIDHLGSSVAYLTHGHRSAGVIFLRPSDLSG